MVLYLKNLDVLTPRLDTNKLRHDNLQDTKEKVCRGFFQRLADLFGHQVYLSLIEKAYSHQPLKLQCFSTGQTRTRGGQAWSDGSKQRTKEVNVKNSSCSIHNIQIISFEQLCQEKRTVLMIVHWSCIFLSNAYWVICVLSLLYEMTNCIRKT